MIDPIAYASRRCAKPTFEAWRRAGGALFPLVLALTFAAPVAAGEAHVIQVGFERMGDAHAFNVTILHEDEGRDHYADRFEIVDMSGEVHAVRVLAHPHVDERPFTRAIGGVRLPAGLGGEVIVRARDSMHGYGGQEFVVKTRKSYACGVPRGSDLTPPAPEPVRGRLKCPTYPPAPPTGEEAPE